MALVAISVSSLAVQQLMHILEPVLIRLAGGADEKPVFGLASTAAGFLVAWVCEIGVLGPIGFSDDIWLNSLVAGLMIGTGTGGFESLLKVLEYAKDEKKRTVAGQFSKKGRLPR